MIRCRHALLSAAVSALLGVSPVMGESLRCQSINGNLNCAGSGGISCQTINGRKVCSSGHGDVVQSFGARPAPDDDEEPNVDTPPALHVERHGPAGHRLTLHRDSSGLHLQTDRLLFDRQQDLSGMDGE